MVLLFIRHSIDEKKESIPTGTSTHPYLGRLQALEFILRWQAKCRILSGISWDKNDKNNSYYPGGGDEKEVMLRNCISLGLVLFFG